MARALYKIIVFTVTIVEVKAFNHSGLPSISQLLRNGSNGINPAS